jgi:hypothetical protein
MGRYRTTAVANVFKARSMASSSFVQAPLAINLSSIARM